MASPREVAAGQHRRDAGALSRSERRRASRGKESRSPPAGDVRRSPGAPTRIAAFAANIVESSWLAALAIVPSFLNLYSHWTFEEDKVLLLRSLAILMAAGMVVWIGAAGRGALTWSGRPVWRLPLVAPVLALAGIQLISTLASIAPLDSFWGAYVRNHGTYTWLAYVAIFLAGPLVCRGRGRVDRVVDAVLIGSLPPSLYAVLQHFGIDLIHWTSEMTERVGSTLGNPIFLGALIIMVVPLTLARLFGACAEAHATVRSTPNRFAGLVRAAPYLALLVLQLLAVLFTQSRGPVVGLAFGLGYFILLAAARQGVRWPVFALVALLALATLGQRLDTPLRSGMESLGRLGDLFDLQRGTGKSRTLLWEGATELLGESPVRTMIGFGPETLRLAFYHVYPPELLRYERRDATPDRIHNETLDALVMTGAFGAIAELALFVCCFYYGLRWLGLVTSRAERNGFVASVVAGGAAGAILPYLLTRRLHFSPLGLSLGIAVALVGHGAWCVLRRPPDVPRALRSSDLLLAGLCAGILAHFVEIQVGVATCATRLYFFTYASLMLVIGVWASTPIQQREAAGGDTAEDVPILPPPEPVTMGAVVGLLLATLIFDFFSATDLRLHGATLTGFLLAPWLFGAALLWEEASRGWEAPAWANGLGKYAGASISLGVLSVIADELWRRSTPDRAESPATMVYRVGLHLADHVSLFYAFVLIGIVFLAAALARQYRPEQNRGAAGWRPLAQAVPFLAGSALIASTNLSLSRADSFAKLGETYEHRGRWSESVYAHEEALRRWPSQDAYAINLTRALVGRMLETGSRNLQRLDADAARAAGVMEAAARAHPLDPYLPTNLARVYRDWAELGDPADRTHRLDLAAAAYERALVLKPRDAPLWNDFAAFRIARGELDKGLEAIAHSLEIDGRFPDTYCLRGDSYLQHQRYEEALADYDRAVEVDPKSLPGWTGKAIALARLGRTDDAATAAARARELSPDDLGGHRGLAALYEQTGQLGDALAEARKALALAEPAERPALQALVLRLENQGAR